MGQSNGPVTLVGVKTVMRRGKAYHYFRVKGAPLIRLEEDEA